MFPPSSQKRKTGNATFSGVPVFSEMITVRAASSGTHCNHSETIHKVPKTA
jgi:hypothetical protein